MADILTKLDVEKIQKEIDERKTVLRPKILADVKSARAQGDLSENFEYYAARKNNRENNSRITYLEKMLLTATVCLTEKEKNELENEVKTLTEKRNILRDKNDKENINENVAKDEKDEELIEVDEFRDVTLRIDLIDKILQNSKIISETTNDIVTFNSIVTVAEIFDGEEDGEITYVVVTSIRADSNANPPRVSIESPIGKALFGKKINDLCHVELDGGKGYDLKIKSISVSTEDYELKAM